VIFFGGSAVATKLDVKFLTLDLQRLKQDGHDSVLVPYEGHLPVYVLQQSPEGYRWDPVARGSAGARVPIWGFHAKSSELLRPFLFGEACQAFFSLPVPVSSITILFDPATGADEVCRMGLLAVAQK